MGAVMKLITSGMLLRGILWNHLFVWVSNFVDQANIVFLWILDFVVLPNIAYKTIKCLYFIEHLNSLFSYIQEFHKNWYLMKNNESTVIYVYIAKKKYHIMEYD